MVAKIDQVGKGDQVDAAIRMGIKAHGLAVDAQTGGIGLAVANGCA